MLDCTHEQYANQINWLIRNDMKYKQSVINFIFAGLLGLIATSLSYASNIASKFESIKQNRVQLEQFLRALPKGGDLHSHVSGATYAENMFEYAKSDALCLNRQTLAVFSNPSCATDDLLTTAIQSQTMRDMIIDSWSMRNFKPGSETGHDHFFAAFSKFGAITSQHNGQLLAEIIQRAGSQNELYLELMMTFDGNKSGELGKKLGWNSDFVVMHNQLLANGIDQIVADMPNTITKYEAIKDNLLFCNTNHPDAGCNVKVRYQYQVRREQAPEMVFAQLLAGFKAALHDPRIVGINLVQTEDGIISMRDYKKQMEMIAFLRAMYPIVNVSLHAGELTTGIVPPDGLKFHIHDAVYTAKAHRIGHGVDVLYEDNAYELLNFMAKNNILVEINLSSNANILNVEGKNHPILTYQQYGVPIALSTDDEGINRSNLTMEYTRAVISYNLNYTQLKNIVRNSIHFSFLPGKSLWQDHHYANIDQACKHDLASLKQKQSMRTLSSQCKKALDISEKATMEWQLEGKFAEFERHFA